MRFIKRLFGLEREVRPPPSEQDQYAALVIEALRGIDPAIELEYRSEQFEFVHPGGQRTFLSNSFVEHGRLTEAERPMSIHRLAAFIVDSRKPLPKGEDALDALLPVLRPRADLIAVTAEMTSWPYARASRPFCDNMLLLLAIDTERAIALVTDETLDELGLSFDEALAIATGHLNDRDNHTFGQLGDGTFISTAGDYYDAGRILIPGLIENLPVKGLPVAIVESRSAVLITGSEDMEGLAQIATFAWADFPENERAVSLTPIVLQDGEWQPLKIEAHHPQPLKNLIQYQRHWSYSATKDTLQEALGDDLFVATPMLMENEGKAATIASWADNVETACPIADAIIIQEADGFPEITRRWEDAMTVCGPFPPIKQVPYPPRFALPGKLDPEKRKLLTEQYGHYDLFADT